jgi:hypothetical protein
MIAALLLALILLGLPTLYFAWRSREFRKFLAGAFFVSAGILFLSLPCKGVGAVARHSSCLDARNQRIALHRPFYLVWPLPLLWFYQKAEGFRQGLKDQYV